MAGNTDFRSILQASLSDALIGIPDLPRGRIHHAGSLSPAGSASLLHQQQSSIIPSGLPLKYSLGQGFSSPGFSSTLADPSAFSATGLSSDNKLLAAVAAANERKMLLAKAQASLVRHQIEEEKKRILLEKSFIDILQNDGQSKSFRNPLHGGMPTSHFDQSSAYSKKTTQVKALEALGSNLRSRTDPYIDVSGMTDPFPEDSELRRTRGGVSEPFPERLHRMLREVEAEGKSEIVSFFSHGRAFGVHDMDRFVSDIMPKYFKQTKWNSFARQLNLYGFIRISSGPDAGGYYHELFLKGRPNLVLHMRRVGVPQGDDRRKFRPKNKNIEPDFYSMKRLS